MGGNRIICEICDEDMNTTDHQPVALPGCGHTFCRLCLIRINNVHEEIKCPSCRHRHVGPQPEDLPTNYALLALLEPQKQNRNKQSMSAEANSSAHLSLDSGDYPKNKPSRPPNTSNETQRSDNTLKALKWIGVGAAAAAGGLALVAAAPVALTTVGFTAAGIAKGSIAAGMMSSAAIANGGGVAAGSLVAVLQSAGAAGIGSTATAALGATGAGFGGSLAYGISKVLKRSRGRSGSNGNVSTDNNDDDGNNDGGGNEKKPTMESKNEDKEQIPNKDKNQRERNKCDSCDECDSETDKTDNGDERSSSDLGWLL